MTRTRRRVPEAWPRCMRKEVAAAYAGLGESTFTTEVNAGRLPKPVPITAGVDVWYREDLDAAIDLIRGAAAASPDDKGELDKWEP